MAGGRRTGSHSELPESSRHHCQDSELSSGCGAARRSNALSSIQEKLDTVHPSGETRRTALVWGSIRKRAGEFGEIRLQSYATNASRLPEGLHWAVKRRSGNGAPKAGSIASNQRMEALRRRGTMPVRMRPIAADGLSGPGARRATSPSCASQAACRRLGEIVINRERYGLGAGDSANGSVTATVSTRPDTWMITMVSALDTAGLLVSSTLAVTVRPVSARRHSAEATRDAQKPSRKSITGREEHGDQSFRVKPGHGSRSLPVQHHADVDIERPRVQKSRLRTKSVPHIEPYVHPITGTQVSESATARGPSRLRVAPVDGSTLCEVSGDTTGR